MQKIVREPVDCRHRTGLLCSTITPSSLLWTLTLAARIIVREHNLAQQGVEKYLKALLVSRQQAFPRTHDIVALLDLCRRHGLYIPVDSARPERLSAYAVQVRYPGEEPTPDEARKAVQIAQTVRRQARAVLRPSSRQS